MEIFVTPMNINPIDPVNPISAPDGFSAEVAKQCGLHHTSGIPEHTKILRDGALDEDQFIEHCRIILGERIKQYRYMLRTFDEGCVFFYFGSTDQLAHVFWRDRDPDHPGYKQEEADKYATLIDDLYVEMDGLVGEALAVLDDDDPLIIMSDHGFGSFRRGLNVNTWLLDEGYVHLVDSADRARASILDSVDWRRSKAYALGINCLYLNLAGREKHGIVSETERVPLLKEIGEKLLQLRDADGSPVVDTAYYVEEYYPGADRDSAPDMLIGYARNYRGSWATTLGRMPPELLEDNLDRWSGDHCIAAHLIPGIVVTNRKIVVADPSLSDMAPTILSVFGVSPPAEMSGRPILRLGSGQAAALDN
jgi:predicted AlkP superfamily phosphohydrolase/phosphomutase